MESEEDKCECGHMRKHHVAAGCLVEICAKFCKCEGFMSE